MSCAEAELTANFDPEWIVTVAPRGSLSGNSPAKPDRLGRLNMAARFPLHGNPQVSNE